MSRRPFEVGDVVVLRRFLYGGRVTAEWDGRDHSQQVGDVGMVRKVMIRDDGGGGIYVTFGRTGEDLDRWGERWFDLVEAADET